MSGYLRWLAERALGPASGLRAAVRPRWFASGSAHDGDGRAAFAEAARPDDFGAAGRQFDAPAPERSGTPRSDAMPAPPLASDASPTAAQTDIAAVAAMPQNPDAPASPSGSDADRRVEHTDDAGVDDRLRRAGSKIADGNTSSPISGPGSVRPAAIAPRMATRLARNRPTRDPSDRRPEAPPVPDVHIHIGRVELTAVTPAAPARRESTANPKKPMSLEEYLRRRSGRPS